MIIFCLFLASSFTCHLFCLQSACRCSAVLGLCVCSPCLCYFRVMSMFLCSFCLWSARNMSMFCVPSSCVLHFIMSIVSVFLLPVFWLLCYLCLCVPFACVLHVMCRCSLFLPFTFCLYDVYVSMFLLSKFYPFHVDCCRCSFCVLFVLFHCYSTKSSFYKAILYLPSFPIVICFFVPAVFLS